MNYVSQELLDKLRTQQQDLRSALQRLEHSLDRSEHQHLRERYRTLAHAYHTHEGLVAALMEAVEPDRPEPRS